MAAIVQAQCAVVGSGALVAPVSLKAARCGNGSAGMVSLESQVSGVQLKAVRAEKSVGFVKRSVVCQAVSVEAEKELESLNIADDVTQVMEICGTCLSVSQSIKLPTNFWFL
jgi:hypothetical protein